MGKVVHIIVLMLENRSFDFMLGFLKHPNPAYPGLTGSEFNRLGPINDPASPRIFVTATGQQKLQLSPDHSHRSVMHQLFGVRTTTSPNGNPTATGFLNDYEDFAVKKLQMPGLGHLIMGCLDSTRVPVLARLALSFGVFTRWFSSVPGETWPNRNFAHAGTSDGEVNINLRLYFNRTIYELLEDNKRTWGLFHDGFPQVFAFPAVLTRGKFGADEKIKGLLDRIAKDRLPSYSFVEPNHFGKKSNSQHPGNNEKDDRDFRAAEALVAEIYRALFNNPKVFNKTLFLVTYDEHGGHFDHVAPPRHPDLSDGRVGDDDFQFDILGPRVPCVAISPWIEEGFVDNETVFDHSSIVHTVRAAMVPSAPPLPTSRDGKTASALHAMKRATPRSPAEMPSPSSIQPSKAAKAVLARRAMREEARSATELDDFQRSLLWLAKTIETQLDAPAGTRLGARRLATVRGVEVTDAALAGKSIADVERETDRVVRKLRVAQKGRPASVATRPAKAKRRPSIMAGAAAKKRLTQKVRRKSRRSPGVRKSKRATKRRSTTRAGKKSKKRGRR